MRGIHGVADEMAVEAIQYVGAVLFDIRIPVTGFAVWYSPDYWPLATEELFTDPMILILCQTEDSECPLVLLFSFMCRRADCHGVQSFM